MCDLERVVSVEEPTTDDTGPTRRGFGRGAYYQGLVEEPTSLLAFGRGTY